MKNQKHIKMLSRFSRRDILKS